MEAREKELYKLCNKGGKSNMVRYYIDNDGTKWDMDEDIGEINVLDRCAFCMEEKEHE